MSRAPHLEKVPGAAPKRPLTGGSGSEGGEGKRGVIHGHDIKSFGDAE